MKDLLRSADLLPEDVAHLLQLADSYKRRPLRRRTLLANESVVLYFNKPSTRTRLSFETAVARLGGTPIGVGPSELQLGRGEEVTAEVVDGPRSVVFDQAENRLHMAAALLEALLCDELEGWSAEASKHALGAGVRR